MLICQKCISDSCEHCNHLSGKCLFLCVFILIIWICSYISRHLLSLNPLQARCRRYSRGER
ncbi:hypothetical protein C9183_26240 (plasmid) [Escherichia coli]|uniref:Uncharacterized protein n=1 Tax=Escherichia coli TaxID=562 RepID=A0A4T5E1X7_ECOLX|nr:hypothetical protein [Salmonella enterica subsp. enterica serovar Coeln]EFI9020716.1 hypothetical protein [Escherichia coli]ECA6387134.1 hypothetical protein [Salmonella enterica subsp. enterica serovar Coeln]MPU49328.1 hypothetical protein [Escherichia coli]TGF76129.1 hypothetical protein DAH35_24140 [Escherichia coli]